MKVSIKNAAQIMGKNTRQIRYLIEQGALPAKKEGGVWFIDKKHLPQSQGQRKASRRRKEKAAQVIEKSIFGKSKQKGYSVLDLRVFQNGLELCHKIGKRVGKEHLAYVIFSESLELVCCGCHAFEAPKKSLHFNEARDMGSAALVKLLLDDPKTDDLVSAIEQDYLRLLGSLIRKTKGGGVS